MRPLAFALTAAVVLGGCAASPASPPGSGNDTVDARNETSDAANATRPISGERPPSMERFVLLANQTLGVLRDGDPPVAEAEVEETNRPTAFYESFATGLELGEWPSFPFPSAWESTGDIEITLKFKSDQAAASSNPKAAGFPGVGAFFGGVGRQAYLLLAADAPDSLEAGRVYTVTLTASPPEGGFFVRPGERLAMYPFLAYAAADGSPAKYVVGGEEPAGFVLPHKHFNISAPRAVVLLDETGELGPNAGPSGDMNQAPVNLPFSVPADAVYVVLEITGAPKAGTRIDIDASIRTPSGEVIQGGFSPYDTETAVIGPGNLAAYGRDLVAHATCAGCPAGGTFALKVTAYGPGIAPAADA